MFGLEKKIVVSSIAILVFMAGLIIYAAFGLGIGVPDCVTTVSPFKKGEIIKKADRLYEVHVVAKMWSFEPSQIQVPPGSTLDIFLSTADVTHGFHLENTNVNLMAVPGTVNYARVKLNEPGIYHVTCHEYCGLGHQSMAAAIVVGDELDTKLFLAQLGHGAGNEAGGDLPGKLLYTSKGCVACHSLDGNVTVGPSFKGLFGKKELLNDGTSVMVDDNYIIESVKAPGAKVVKGFQPLMPVLQVSDEELKQIIAYIKTLN